MLVSSENGHGEQGISDRNAYEVYVGLVDMQST